MKSTTLLTVRRRLRAKLPPPLVTIRAIEKLLLRHISAPPSGPLPEQRLIVAMICQAIADLRCGTPAEQQEAQHFLMGENLSAWAQWVDLQPGFIREVAIKTRYLLLAACEYPASSTQGGASDSVPERRSDAGLQFHPASI